MTNLGPDSVWMWGKKLADGRTLLVSRKRALQLEGVYDV